MSEDHTNQNEAILEMFKLKHPELFEMPPAEIRAGIDIATGNRHWVPADVSFFPYLTPYTRKDLSFPADKVMELVKAVDILRNYAWDCMEGRKQTEKFVKLNCPVESLINALFPEGVEK